MWEIIKNEINSLKRNRPFIGVSIGFVIVLFLTVFLGNLQTEKQTKNYEVAKNKLRNQWENIEGLNAHGAAHFGTYVFKPSNLLSSLDEGINSVTGNVIKVEGHVQNEIVHSEASQVQFISRFGKLKSSLLLQFVISLLLIFLAFNAVNTEKQSGRLKLLIMQGARPSSLIWAKTLSIWGYGILLLTLNVFVYAVVNADDINSQIIFRVILYYLSYALFYFIIICLTVFLTSFLKNASIALTSMLGVWIIWTIFLPNILKSSVEKISELPTRSVFIQAMKDDRAKGIDGHNPSDERALKLEAQILTEYGVDSLSQLPINFDGIRMQADEEYGNIVWDKHFGNLREIYAHQKVSYQLLGVFNPFMSLQNSSMGFAGTDNFHHQEFLVQIENYRRVLIKSLNDQHANGGSKTGDWSLEPDSDFYKSVPDFQFKMIPLDVTFSKYIIDLLMLIIWALLASLLLVLGTKKAKLL